MFELKNLDYVHVKHCRVFEKFNGRRLAVHVHHPGTTTPFSPGAEKINRKEETLKLIHNSRCDKRFLQTVTHWPRGSCFSTFLSSFSMKMGN